MASAPPKRSFPPLLRKAPFVLQPVLAHIWLFGKQARPVILQHAATILTLFVAALCLLPQPAWLRVMSTLRWGSWFLLALVWLAKRPAPLFTREDLPVVIFAVALIPSVVCAERPQLAWNGRGGAWIGYRELVLMGVAWYLLARHTMRWDRLRRLTLWLIAGATVAAAIGYLEIWAQRNVLYEWWFPHRQYRQFLRLPRMMSTQQQPILLGTLMVVCIPLVAHHMVIAARRTARLLWGLLAVLLLGALVLTFSRGSLIGLAAGLGAYVIALRRIRWLWLVPLLIAGVILGSSLVAGGGSFRYSVRGLRQVTQQPRWGHAALAWQMTREHPWSGVGLNHYRYLYDRYRPGNTTRYVLKIPDNMHVGLLAETGFVGVAGFLWLLWSTWRRWGRAIARTRALPHRSLLAAIGAGWCGVLANMLTYDALLWTLPLTFFWIWLGILYTPTPLLLTDAPAVRRAVPLTRRTSRAAPTALPPITAIEWLGVGSLLAALTWWINARCLQSFLFSSDFGNLFHALRLSAWQLVQALLLLDWGFRPVGLFVYQALHRLCGLEAFWYHALLLGLHVLACAQAYWLTLRLTRSRFVALATCLGLVYQFAYRDIFWHFGKVFEVLAALCYWQAFAWYLEARHAGGVWRWTVSIGVFMLALGSKEMAVTLPVMLTLYELLWETSWRSSDRRTTWCRMLMRRQWPYYALATLFFVQHFLFKDAAPMQGYVFVFTPATWLDGMAYYVREWGCAWWPSSWLFVCGGLALALAWRLRDRVLTFAWCYVPIAFLPIIFLAHHRYPWYWYIPQFGAALFAAQLLHRGRELLTSRAPFLRTPWLRWSVALTLAAMPLWTALHASAARRPSLEQWYLTLSDEYRGFMRQMQALHPTVPRRSLLVFTQSPSLLDAEYLTYFLRLIYHDNTVEAVLQPAAAMNQAARRRPVLFFSYAEGRVREMPAPVLTIPNDAPQDGRP